METKKPVRPDFFCQNAQDIAQNAQKAPAYNVTFLRFRESLLFEMFSFF